MGIKTLSDNIIVVVLSTEQRAREELAAINEKASKGFVSDVIVDFTYVEVLTSTSISNLITLQNWLKEAGRQLVLCNVSVITKCIFDVSGLDVVFKFASNGAAAIKTIKSARPQ